jgi:hypothetical protein
MDETSTRQERRQETFQTPRSSRPKDAFITQAHFLLSVSPFFALRSMPTLVQSIIKHRYKKGKCRRRRHSTRRSCSWSPADTIGRPGQSTPGRKRRGSSRSAESPSHTTTVVYRIHIPPHRTDNRRGLSRKAWAAGRSQHRHH